MGHRNVDNAAFSQRTGDIFSIRKKHFDRREGYLVAKIDRIFDVAMKQDENVNGRFVGRLLLFVSVFATRCASTFVW